MSAVFASQKHELMEHLLDRLSTHLKNAIANSISLAASFGHPRVDPIHILSALATEEGCVAAEIILRSDIDIDDLHNIVSKLDRREGRAKKEDRHITATLPPLSDTAKHALEKGMMLAYEHASRYIGTEHLLYGIIALEDKEILFTMDKHNVNTDEIREYIHNIVQNTAQFPSTDEMASAVDELHDIGDADSHPPHHSQPKKRSILQNLQSPQGTRFPQKQQSPIDMFTIHLTDPAFQKTVDPVIGREKEIERLIHILSRRNKNNPALVGEPGVGKTAIVEGLAKRIMEGNVPDILKQKKILSLDLTLLIAGTIYRGEFEARLKHIIDEVAAEPNTILFIDEIHNIIGAGSNQGTMDAANILKPALARGQLRCIGATTIDEYKKHIESDPALERRFQPIDVEEPSTEEALEILTGLKQYYDAFHHVDITKDAIAKAVELSTKYVHDNYLPDKAIDLIDEAAASVRVKQQFSPAEKKLQALNKKLESFKTRKERAILDEQFDKALDLKKQENRVEEEIIHTKKEAGNGKTRPRMPVTGTDVARILARRFTVDERTLLENDWEKLDHLAADIQTSIIGQDAAVARVVEALRQAQLGLKQAHKPFASILFAGPSGVGKTALARVLAQSLYHDDKALIKLDMSEFAESHGVSKLLGSPAGYIGHKDRNRFTDEIKKRPYSIILFDEIDKAHPDVIKLLLQILDEGVLTDSAGKKVYFNHSIIILTTNIGAELYASHGIGFDRKDALVERDRAIEAKIKEELGASIMGRIATTCLFSPLQNADIEHIIKKQIASINTELAKERISVSVEDALIAELAAQSRNDDAGARYIEQTVQGLFSKLVSDILKKKRRKKTYELQKVKDAYKLV
jgi:ATP-dependent Clp protease ATP-binding subunit ClpC